MPNGILNTEFSDIVLIIRRISLKRLIDGGAAMLAHRRMNHHSEINGKLIINPLVRGILRV